MTVAKKSNRSPIVVTEGFRFFFLAAALFAEFAMLVWIGWLAVHAGGGALTYVPFAVPPHHWHAHEMIYGYGLAVVAGFFLTAVPSWTGAPPARTTYISAIALLWLLGRISIFFSNELPASLVMLIDLAFVPVISLKIALNLFKRPKPQNLLFLVLLTLLFAGNLAVHLEWMRTTQDTASAGLLTGLLTLAALIAVLGGRVTPAFTRNAMLKAGHESGLPASNLWLDRVGIVSAIALASVALFDADARVLAVLSAVAAVSNGLRLFGWRLPAVLDQPIVWSLHLGFAMMVLGYCAVSLHWAGFDIGKAAALHLLGIGAIGVMTLAMMSRASLGHTGRPLVVSPSIAWAYGMVAFAAIVRSLGLIVFPDHYFSVMFAAGGLWIAAFAVFLAMYFPILVSPRQDRAG